MNIILLVFLFLSSARAAPVVNHSDFLALFTAGELTAINALPAPTPRTDPSGIMAVFCNTSEYNCNIYVFWHTFTGNVDLGSAIVVNRIQQMVSAGILTQPRADRILMGLPPQ